MNMSFRNLNSHLNWQNLKLSVSAAIATICGGSIFGDNSANAQLASDLQHSSIVDFDASNPSHADFQFLANQRSVSLASLLQETDMSESDQLSLEIEDDDSTLRDALRMLAEEDDSESLDTGREKEEADAREEDGAEKSLNDARSIWSRRQSSYSEGRFQLPPIKAVSIDSSEVGNGAMPKGFRDNSLVPVNQLPESGLDRELPWQWSTRHWAAANTFSHPLYFEDRMLERHGHQRYPYLQPFVSGGRFLAGSVLLPYLSAVSPPSECQYTLGYYRTGNCVPALKQRPPWKRKAAAAQATGVVSGVWVLP